MKHFLLLFAVLLFTTLSFAQDLPHQMTEEEKLLWPSYHPQILS